ncbi:Glycosyl transferase, group 1 family protein [Chitinispirillum alkaliphilum]|nr:Glycosyl transferase, group 1 family protein [Chitinispirillum alkaliphilum]
MKLLYICSEYPPCSNFGGIGTVTKTLAESLAERGHDIYIAGMHGDISDDKSETINGVNVFRFRSKNLSRKEDLFYRIRFAIQISQIIRRFQVEIIETPDFFGLSPFVPVPFANKKPLVVRLHGSSTFLSEDQNIEPSRYFRIWESKVLKTADALVGVSSYIIRRTNEIFQLPKKPTFLIHNPVKLIPPAMQSAPKQEKVVVFSGTLMRLKGVYSLIKAWNLVAEKEPNAKLVMFGKDSQENGKSVLSQLKTLLKPSILHTVTFHGHVDQRTIFNALCTANVAVFPSYTESLGMAPLEAMSVGCPTIFTQRSSGPEVISDMEDGILVNPDCPEEIAEKILFCFQNPEKAQRLGGNGHAKVKTKFNLEDIIIQNENMYSKVIKSRQNA